MIDELIFKSWFHSWTSSIQFVYIKVLWAKMQEKLYNCGAPEDENTLRLQSVQVLDHCIHYFDEECSILKGNSQ